MSGLSERGRQGPLGGTEGALKRYRVMAMVVGTGLALLCFVGIPLQVAGIIITGHNKWPWTSVVAIVGTMHGFLYIVYLLSCLDLAGRARFKTVQLLGMLGSGLLPLLAFYMERKVAQRVKAQLALGAAAPPSPVASMWAALAGRRSPPGPTGPGEADEPRTAQVVAATPAPPRPPAGEGS